MRVYVGREDGRQFTAALGAGTPWAAIVRRGGLNRDGRAELDVAVRAPADGRAGDREGLLEIRDADDERAVPATVRIRMRVTAPGYLLVSDAARGAPAHEALYPGPLIPESRQQACLGLANVGESEVTFTVVDTVKVEPGSPRTGFSVRDGSGAEVARPPGTPHHLRPGEQARLEVTARAPKGTEGAPASGWLGSCLRLEMGPTPYGEAQREVFVRGQFLRYLRRASTPSRVAAVAVDVVLASLLVAAIVAGRWLPDPTYAYMSAVIAWSRWTPWLSPSLVWRLWPVAWVLLAYVVGMALCIAASGTTPGHALLRLEFRRRSTGVAAGRRQVLCHLLYQMLWVFRWRSYDAGLQCPWQDARTDALLVRNHVDEVLERLSSRGAAAATPAAPGPARR